MINPRITDYHGIYKCQAELDFAIQSFDEDIPLYLDPFLLWKSPSLQDQALHIAILNAINNLLYLYTNDNKMLAINILIQLSECNEVGLGLSKKRSGNRISQDLAIETIESLLQIQQRQKNIEHFEVVQLILNGISKDRISDISCNIIKSFLIDYTIDQCTNINIPLNQFSDLQVYSSKKNVIISENNLFLPINPQNCKPLIFVPKRWLRFVPWINYDDYYKDYCPKDKINQATDAIDRVKVLMYNRENYGVVENYITVKEREASNCHNDPLFSQLPVTSVKRKIKELTILPSGKENNADKTYEDIISELFATLLYPHLDFAKSQSRTDSGVLIRDLIFYNNRSIDFLDEIFTEFDNTQIVFEIKNVKSIERDHINQLNRYLSPSIGRFGVFITRNEPSRAMFKNTIDLWSGQRKAIIFITDEDIKLMCEVYESKQRIPYEVLKKKYIEFRRSCPS